MTSPSKHTHSYRPLPCIPCPGPGNFALQSHSRPPSLVLALWLFLLRGEPGRGFLHTAPLSPQEACSFTFCVKCVPGNPGAVNVSPTVSCQELQVASQGCSSHTCLALRCGLHGNTLPLNARKRWDLNFISTKSEVAFLISAKSRKEFNNGTSSMGCKTVERASCVQWKAGVPSSCLSARCAPPPAHTPATSLSHG